MRYDLTEGDLEQPIGAILTDSATATALPTDATVTFTMSQADGTKRVSGLAVIDDPVLRQVHYQWQPGDTSVPGIYWAQWTINYGTNLPESFPSDEPFYVIVHPSL